MKYSRQRELIEATVKERNTHPTADDVYDILKPNNPNLSLGTVYRNLNQLAEHGLINKLYVPNDKDRFDGFINEHSHMICSNCNTIYDMDLDLLKQLKSSVYNKTGFELSTSKIVVNGICANCKADIQ